MTFTYSITSPKLDKLLSVLGPSNRHYAGLLATATRQVQETVKSYLERLANTKHNTANRLGATPSGHFEKNVADITASVEGNQGHVVIPIAGISRAFHDVTIRPQKASKLTLPIAAPAYGTTVTEMRSAGWVFFRPPAKRAKRISENPRRFNRQKNLLMGVFGEEKPVPMWALKDACYQSQDRDLLPSDEALGHAAENGAQKYIQEIAS